MAIPALGTSPITVVDPVTGAQYQIPLSLISFSQAGPLGQPSLNATLLPPAFTASASLPGVAADLLNILVAQGLLLPSPSPAAVPAVTITANDKGSQGNSIAVTLAGRNISPANVANTTYTVTVVATDVYSGLTLGTIGSVLGSGGAGETPGSAPTTPGSQPGLMYPVGTVEQTVLPAIGTYQPTSSGQISIALPGSPPTTFFVLNPVHGGASDSTFPTFLSASILNVNTTTNTFTLIVSWTKQVAGVTLGVLTGSASPFASLLNFATFGSVVVAPDNGTVVLTGGKDGTTPTAARVVVVSTGT